MVLLLFCCEFVLELVPKGIADVVAGGVGVVTFLLEVEDEGRFGGPAVVEVKSDSKLTFSFVRVLVFFVVVVVEASGGTPVLLPLLF